MFKSLRNAFLTGIFVLLPIVVTLFTIDFLLSNIGLPICHLLLRVFHVSIPQNGILAVGIYITTILFLALLIAELGYLSTYMFGRWIIRLFEQIIAKLPFINIVYKTVKQIVDTFRQNSASIFNKTVLVEFPHKGCYAIGFLTSETQGEVQIKTQEEVVNIFLPTTPNPTTGFLLLIPKKDVIELDMSVTDGMKMIISGGVVNPPYRPTIDNKKN
jgi:uncharacterized membrane protein